MTVTRRRWHQPKTYIPRATYRCVSCRLTYSGRHYQTGSECPSCGGYLERVAA